MVFGLLLVWLAGCVGTSGVVFRGDAASLSDHVAPRCVLQRPAGIAVALVQHYGGGCVVVRGEEVFGGGQHMLITVSQGRGVMRVGLLLPCCWVFLGRLCFGFTVLPAAVLVSRLVSVLTPALTIFSCPGFPRVRQPTAANFAPVESSEG